MGHGCGHDRDEAVAGGGQRSPDLLTWEPLPIALAPTPGGEDTDGCFSGNAVSDGDQLIAYYSAYRRDRWSQPVTTAESRDNGRTFRPRGDLLIPQPPETCTMYRDPYVWREGERWRMLVGAPLDNGRGLLILSSWNSSGDPGCVIARAGREHDGTFHPETDAGVLLDHGPDFYAAALLRAPGERWLLWGWSWEACEPSWSGERGWAGVLTVPREITLTKHNRPYQQPAAELLDLRRARHSRPRAVRDRAVRRTRHASPQLRPNRAARHPRRRRAASGHLHRRNAHRALLPGRRGPPAH